VPFLKSLIGAALDEPRILATPAVELNDQYASVLKSLTQ